MKSKDPFQVSATLPEILKRFMNLCWFCEKLTRTCCCLEVEAYFSTRPCVCGCLVIQMAHCWSFFWVRCSFFVLLFCFNGFGMASLWGTVKMNYSQMARKTLCGWWAARKHLLWPIIFVACTIRWSFLNKQGQFHRYRYPLLKSCRRWSLSKVLQVLGIKYLIPNLAKLCKRVDFEISLGFGGSFVMQMA